jgi:hypothetical protein
MNYKKLLFALAFLVILPLPSYGQLLQWNTFGNLGTEISEPSVANDANISASNLTLGAGVTAAANGNRFGGNNWWDTGDAEGGTTLTESITGNDYIQFVVTPNAGCAFTPTSFVFSWDRSNSGPNSLTLRSSSDGYSSDLGTVTGLAAAITSGNTITISGLTNIAIATTFRLYGYGTTATATVGTGGFDIATSVVNVQLNGTTAATAKITKQDGPWYDTNTWTGLVIPTSADNVIINHNVTNVTSGANISRGTKTTVINGSLSTGAFTYAADGTTIVNGTFQIETGGWATTTNSTNFVYGSAGTLNLNKSGSAYVVNNGDVFWPATSGPVNVNVLQGGLTMNSASRTVTGVFTTAAAVTLTSCSLTLNGTCQINGGGYFNNSPIYGASSLLRYNINGYYGRGFEWTTTAATIGTTPGYPNDIQMSNNTTLDFPNTGAAAFSSNLGLNRDLIIDAGSSLYMDYGGFNKSGSLSVGRNITISGNLSLGNAVFGDLFVGGNWTRTGTFSPNLRAVNFTGSTAQSLTGTTTFDYVTMNGAGGLTLNNNITVNQNLVFTSGKITLGTSDLTLVGTVSGATTSNYVVTNSTGQFKKIVVGSAVLFPVGNSAYNPITFTNIGTSDTYGVRVVDGAITTGTSNTKTVRRSWVTTEAVAGNSVLAVVAQYNTGEPDTGFAAATTPYIGFYNGTSWSQVGATLSGSNPFTATSTANTSPSDLTTGTQYFAIGKDNAFTSVATKLVITAITPTSPTAGVGFSITIRSQDVYNDFSNVVVNTAFTISTNGAAGAIAGTITGTIPAGTSTITVTGVILPTASALHTVTLTATRTSGDTLTAGTSSLFTVLPAASQLAFVGVPATGFVGVNIASFTVEARRPNNSVDNTFTGNITIAIATGSGILSGTLTVAAVAGVATFNTAQFDTATVYTIITTSGSLTTATSGTINITQNTDFYRSITSGSWNAASTWESSVDGSTGWGNATQTPTAFNTVYIQSGHTVTLTKNEACKDLNIVTNTINANSSTNLGKIALASHTLSVNGKMRNYYAPIGTVPGISWGSGYNIYPFTATTGGKVSIVGTTRTVFNSGEWGATITTPSSGVFPLQINMANNSQVATFATNVKCTNFNLVTGTVSGAVISADTGTAGFGDITIGTGTTLISSADSTVPFPGINVFQRTGTTLAGTLTIAGTLKLIGALPKFAMTAVVNETGTVEYGGADQTFMGVANSGVAMTYNNVIISGTGIKSLLSSPTLLNGDLNVNASNFVIKADEVIEVKKSVNVAATGATFEIKNNGQLIQVDDIANGVGEFNGNNTGNIIYNRTATGIKGYDYVYWGSPVTGQDISTIYSSPSPGFKYFWNPLANNVNSPSPIFTSGNWEPAFGVMNPGKGYIVRGSSSYGMAATDIPAVFTGVPNNGIITATVSRGGNQTTFGPLLTTNNSTVTNFDDNWNLLGNPYPSAIDPIEFLKATNNPNIEGFVYLWTHTNSPTSTVNPFYGSFAANYFSDYFTYNSMGASSGPLSQSIAAGQGFFVCMNDGEAVSGETVTFKNSMRSKTIDNSQFYRTSQVDEKYRIWLDLVDANNQSVRTLIGYATEATLGLDRMYDAQRGIDNEINIYSLVEDKTLNIQGRPMPFDQNDQVTIGVNILSAGDYKIAIAAVDGLFEQGQTIYLEDKELNLIYDLRQNPYSFSTTAGKFSDRFVLRYTNQALGNPDFVNIENSIIVAGNHGELTIKSSIENIQEVTVYELLGRQLFFAKAISNTNFVTSNITMSQQTLIVKIKLENGMTISRKIIL